ncbi:hypothetical protein GF325_13395 [Candidatus Bathyarchaeota archaeon]|nr:hypothetical protein [Candidatus Bathyarchaeota archaeon]
MKKARDDRGRTCPHPKRCTECHVQLVFQNTGYTCPECGLVYEECNTCGRSMCGEEEIHG